MSEVNNIAVGDIWLNEDKGYGAAPPKGPAMKPETGVKLRPLAFYDQIESIQKPTKIPGTGTRMQGSLFYIRIPRSSMEKFKTGQVSRVCTKQNNTII